MIVLFVLLGSLLVYRGLGAAGISPFDTWTESARWALATMFIFTGIAHFGRERRDLIAMVPPALPRPDWIVTLTGFLEFAGAGGLLLEMTRRWAAWGLIALLIAMFPANVSAAKREVGIRGRAHTPMWLRAPMQVLFIAWTWWVR
jgi:uncharacterized membrane protein